MFAGTGESPTFALGLHPKEIEINSYTSPARPLSSPPAALDPALGSSRLALRLADADKSAASDWDPVEIMGSGKGSILKSRASSGELGLLFDRAVRLAELVEAERETVLSTIATGKAIGRPTSSPPDGARPASSTRPGSPRSSTDSRNGHVDKGNVPPWPPNDQHGIQPHKGTTKGGQQAGQHAPRRFGPASRRQSSRSSDPSHPPHAQFAPQPYYDPGQRFEPTQILYSVLDPRSSPQRFAPPYPESPPPAMFAAPPPPLPSSQYGYQPYFPHPEHGSHSFLQPSPYTPYYPPLTGQHREDQASVPSAGAGSHALGHNPLLNHISFQSLPPGPPLFHHFASPASSVYSPYSSHEPTFAQIHDQHNPPPLHTSRKNSFPSYTDPFSYPSSNHSRWSSAGSLPPHLNPPHPPLPFQPNPTSQHIFGGQNVPYASPLHSAPPPLLYQPPFEAEPTRGKFAQVNFRQALEHGIGAGGGPQRRRSQGPRSTLPKPPAHSPHALWVGNVPSDATHVELWRFFTLRPVPSSSSVYASAAVDSSEIDLDSTGVESIHLIQRSNCAFVNYVSDIHLQHSIAVSHNVSLRPFDTRCKELVCRVRKREDDTKSGVGAQRTGGMHHAYVTRMALAGESAPMEDESTSLPAASQRHRHSTTSSGGSRSQSTTSTTSTFLSKYFPKRFFVLKSHDETDLRMSVEKGLWATQSHNEPVLDQAFRTCSDGVYLIFSANKSGEFFGYGKMTSAITNSPERTMSWTNRTSASSAFNSAESRPRPPAIPEGEEATEFPATRPRMLFTESEHRLADESPAPLTPSGSKGTTPAQLVAENLRASSAPASINPGREAHLSAGGHAVAAKLRLPGDDKPRHGGSLDPKALAVIRNLPSPPEYHQSLLEQQLTGATHAVAQSGGDGVLRKDTLPPAEERNARLEKLRDIRAGGDDTQASAGWGRPFKVEWIKVGPLPFSRTKDITNAFNSDREVKISRDGTEIEPSAGEQLIQEFWKDAGGEPSRTSPAASAASQASGMVRSE